MHTTTIKQKIITLTLEGRGSIEVFRMKHKAARALLLKIATHTGAVREIFQGDAAPATEGTVNVLKILAKLPELITKGDDLVQHLCLNSTTLKPEELDDLDMIQSSAVVEAAVELNLGDELKNSLAGIVKTFQNLMTRTSSGESSTPS